MKIQDKNLTQGLEIPWFIRKFRENYIMLFRDFESITGVHLSGNYTSLKRGFRLEGGRDYNGWGIGECSAENKEKFKEEYGFEYGDDYCMMYLYFDGITKALRIGKNEIDHEAYKIISEAVRQVRRAEEYKSLKWFSTTEAAAYIDGINLGILIASEKKGATI